MKKKILFIDDDKDILEVVNYLLEAHGFEVKTHESGLGVVEIVKDYLPDLILLDVNLPGKDGLDVCEELQRVVTTPIIMFTAMFFVKEGSEKMKNCKANAVIRKPFDILELITKINSLL